jgi:phosphoribosylformylglycinamidine synthase PurS subunit
VPPANCWTASRIYVSAGQFIINEMKAHVYVTLKRTVLDPQGQTIHGALKRMQYTGVEEVRQGKYFQLTLRAMDTADARSEVERIAREVLTNPVIEEFTYHLEE